jgi:hypothetical protein
MDPVSFAASIVTLVGVTTATGKGLKRLASLKDVPDQLLQLHNEVCIDTFVSRTRANEHPARHDVYFRTSLLI